jgi:hypothetical protein
VLITLALQIAIRPGTWKERKGDILSRNIEPPRRKRRLVQQFQQHSFLGAASDGLLRAIGLGVFVIYIQVVKSIFVEHLRGKANGECK